MESSGYNGSLSHGAGSGRVAGGGGGEARAQADWLVGLNATRGLPLRQGTAGTGTLGVGRVQTPPLALIAQRDPRIAAFTPDAFTPVRCVVAGGTPYPAIWHPQDPPDPEHPDRVPADAARHAGSGHGREHPDRHAARRPVRLSCVGIAGSLARGPCARRRRRVGGWRR